MSYKMEVHRVSVKVEHCGASQIHAYSNFQLHLRKKRKKERKGGKERIDRASTVANTIENVTFHEKFILIETHAPKLSTKYIICV